MTTLTAAAAEVEQFNQLVPVGTPVIYWPGIRMGKGKESMTRTPAWLIGGHTAVVSVEGYGGGIALTHVMPVTPTDAPDDGGPLRAPLTGSHLCGGDCDDPCDDPDPVRPDPHYRPGQDREV